MINENVICCQLHRRSIKITPMPSILLGTYEHKLNFSTSPGTFVLHPQHIFDVSVSVPTLEQSEVNLNMKTIGLGALGKGLVMAVCTPEAPGTR